MDFCSRRETILLAFASLLFAFAAPSIAADDGGAYLKLAKDKGSAIVTVKFLLKLNMGPMFGGSGEQESETEINGVLIDSKGLVLVSNTQLGGFIGMMKRFMGPMGEGVTANPTDIKVLIGDDTEGRPADIVARDTELDLAWVRVKEPGEQVFPFVDFSQETKPGMGDTVFVLRRLGKYFARSLVAADGRIAGTTMKPRELYVPTPTLAGSFGMPAFSADGKPVGLVVMLAPDEEDGDANPMAMLGRMSGMQEMMAGFILPAAEVVKATRRALETKSGE